MFDIDKRENFAEYIINIINSSDDLKHDDRPLTVAIDSEWGTGKSKFIQDFIDKYCNHKYKMIVFNAWMEDNNKTNPLISLAYRIYEENEVELYKYEVLTRFIMVVKSAFKWIYGVFTKKIILLKLFDCFGGLKREYFDIYIGENERNQKYETLLGKINSDSKKVIIIDELDRCSPKYAINLLESIKHFMNREDYIFIYTLDFDQLEKSIHNEYGLEKYSESYLRRFLIYIYYYQVLIMKLFVMK